MQTRYTSVLLVPGSVAISPQPWLSFSQLTMASHEEQQSNISECALEKRLFKLHNIQRPFGVSSANIARMRKFGAKDSVRVQLPN